MKRRTFVQTLGATAASLLVARRAFAQAKLDPIGLELYSVRNAMHADPERTLAAVRAIGYTDVELLWSQGNFGRTPQQVRASLDQEGLRAPSAHLAPEEIINRATWTTRLQTAQFLGHQYLIVPSLPDETQHSLDAWRAWADRFNSAGTVARSAGIWLGFHNEPDHMKPIDGAVPYDLFIERLDPSVVRLQLDVGNMLLGGGDPMRYLERYRDRYLELPSQGRSRRSIARHRTRNRRVRLCAFSRRNPGDREQTVLRRTGEPGRRTSERAPKLRLSARAQLRLIRSVVQRSGAFTPASGGSETPSRAMT